MSRTTIPVFSSETGRFIRYERQDRIEANSGQFVLVKNQRGRLKKAFLKALPPFDCASNLGHAFVQVLSTGRAYALQGVRGSSDVDLMGRSFEAPTQAKIERINAAHGLA
jgi:hypothetical protein